MKISKNHIFLFLTMILLTSSTWSAEKLGRYRNPMRPSFLLELIAKLESGQNVTFAKYGDGEYFCMIGLPGTNIDKDSYHHWLGEELKKSLISLSQKPNTYIGKWWNEDAYNYCDSIAKASGVSVPWAWYHLVLNDDDTFRHNYLYKFVKFIVETDRKVILMCNAQNKRLKEFFRADALIEIPASNWSFEYDKWKSLVEEHMEKDAILLTCAGMCSKVLINEITDKYDVTCIDLGSSFDFLARKHATRSHSHTYEEELRYYKDFLPESWDK